MQVGPTDDTVAAPAASGNLARRAPSIRYRQRRSPAGHGAQPLDGRDSPSCYGVFPGRRTAGPGGRSRAGVCAALGFADVRLRRRTSASHADAIPRSTPTMAATPRLKAHRGQIISAGVGPSITARVIPGAPSCDTAASRVLKASTSAAADLCAVSREPALASTLSTGESAKVRTAMSARGSGAIFDRAMNRVWSAVSNAEYRGVRVLT